MGRERSSILLLFLRVTTMSPHSPMPLPTVFTSFTSWYAASNRSAAPNAHLSRALRCTLICRDALCPCYELREVIVGLPVTRASECHNV